ncbi:MAG: hypothetical protein ACYC6Y_31605, partial [Thermoguttaceae bacterium]
APGAYVDPRVGKPKLQSPIQKPNASPSMRKLPVWGFYGRNVGRLEIDGLRIATGDDADTRPVIRIDNTRQVILSGFEHSPLPPGAADAEWNSVGSLDRRN